MGKSSDPKARLEAGLVEARKQVEERSRKTGDARMAAAHACMAAGFARALGRTDEVRQLLEQATQLYLETFRPNLEAKRALSYDSGPGLGEIQNALMAAIVTGCDAERDRLADIPLPAEPPTKEQLYPVAEWHFTRALQAFIRGDRATTLSELTAARSVRKAKKWDEETILQGEILAALLEGKPAAVKEALRRLSRFLDGRAKPVLRTFTLPSGWTRLRLPELGLETLARARGAAGTPASPARPATAPTSATPAHCFLIFEGAHGKFWEARVEDRWLVVRFGARGAAGQTRRERRSSTADARAELARRADEKRMEGYRDAKPEAAPAPSSKRAAAAAKTPGAVTLDRERASERLADSRKRIQECRKRLERVDAKKALDSRDRGLRAIQVGALFDDNLDAAGLSCALGRDASEIEGYLRDASRIAVRLFGADRAVPQSIVTHRFQIDGPRVQESNVVEVAHREDDSMASPGNFLRALQAALAVDDADTLSRLAALPPEAFHSRLVTSPAPLEHLVDALVALLRGDEARAKAAAARAVDASSGNGWDELAERQADVVSALANRDRAAAESALAALTATFRRIHSMKQQRNDPAGPLELPMRAFEALLRRAK